MEKLRPGEGLSEYLELLKKTLTASVYDESAWVEVDPETLNFGIKSKYFHRIARHWTTKLLRKESILLVRKTPFSAAIREVGKDWPLMGYTLVGHRRLNNVQICVEDVLSRNVPGDLVETGVWRGGTVIFMRALLKAYGVSDRKVWAADSFEGLPVPKSAEDGADLSEVAYLKVSLDEVKSNFVRFGLLDDQVEFLKGWFRDTLPRAPIRAISVLRLDGDLYGSTMDSLQNLYGKVSKGGYVIVDDYYSWPSCRQAVTDFLAANSLKVEIIRVDWTGAYWQV
jgi:O-methyltransferase